MESEKGRENSQMAALPAFFGKREKGESACHARDRGPDRGSEGNPEATGVAAVPTRMERSPGSPLGENEASWGHKMGWNCLKGC